MSRSKGFTLLETIAAITVLALAFTALLKVAGSALDLSSKASDRSAAAEVARSVLDNAFVEAPLAAGVNRGDYDGGHYRWVLTVTPWQPAEIPSPMLPQTPLQQQNPAPYRLYRVDLELSWKHGRQQHKARFSTLRLARSV